MYYLATKMITFVLFLMLPAMIQAVPTVKTSSSSSVRQRPLQRAKTYADHLMVPLEFQDFAKKKPRKKNLKRSRLLRKMGEDFDDEWMSIEAPPPAEMDVEVVQTEQVEELVRQISELDLERELAEMAGDIDNEVEDAREGGGGNNNNKAMISVFEQWLVKRSSCPVRYTWEDLGEYFWPRWIRRGHCGDEDSVEEDPGRVCSWPAGMRCLPGAARTLHILRWHCRRRKPGGGGPGRHRCKWFKIPYPITSGCRCAC